MQNISAGSRLPEARFNQRASRNAASQQHTQDQNTLVEEACFALKLSDIGFEDTKPISHSDWVRDKATLDLSIPHVITDVNEFDNVRNMEIAASDTSSSANLNKSMKMWMQKFGSSTECKSSGKVIAPLFDAMSAEVANTLKSSVFSTEDIVTSSLPAFTATRDNICLYGAANGTVHIWPVQLFLATLRFQCSGNCRFIIVKATDINHANGSISLPSRSKLTSTVRNMNEENVKLWKVQTNFLRDRSKI